jgi:hypothetical protein
MANDGFVVDITIRINIFLVVIAKIEVILASGSVFGGMVRDITATFESDAIIFFAFFRGGEGYLTAGRRGDERFKLWNWDSVRAGIACKSWSVPADDPEKDIIRGTGSSVALMAFVGLSLVGVTICSLGAETCWTTEACCSTCFMSRSIPEIASSGLKK